MLLVPRSFGLVLLLGLCLGTAPALFAQEEEVSEESLQMSVQLQEKLGRLNDQWLVWNAAFLQGNQPMAATAVRDLLFSVEDLGMKTLPDLAFGMINRGVDAAREGDVQRARWALEMAEQLEPNRPETAIARGRVAAIDGQWVEAGSHWFGAAVRLFEDRLTRFLWSNNIAIWLLCALMLAGGAFVAVLFATKGGRLCRDMASRFGSLPTPIGYALVVAFLAWPFVLQRGWIWLVFLWAVFLWGYCERNERWVITFVCIVFGVAPVIVLQLQREVEVAVSDQMRAVDGVIEGRLHGKLLTDVAKLRRTLPDSRAVTQLIADAHVRLGQDQMARPLYRALSDAEPSNGAALTNLGVYHTSRGEHFQAIPFFEKAGEVSPDLFEPHYNLALSYRELLEFDRADANLEQARFIDSESVGRWVNESRPPQIVAGGFLRRNEIKAELERDWLGGSGDPLKDLLANAASAPLALLIPILGMIVARILGPRPGSDPVVVGEGFLDRILRWLVPGLAWAEEENGVRAYISLMIPMFAVTFPLMTYFGYRVPTGYDPGQAATWIVAAVVVGLFYMLRLRLLAK